MPGLLPDARALLFVQRIEQGHTLAKAIGCKFYRGKKDTSLTDADQDNNAKRWYSGAHKIMVVTDAFRPGNNYPHVRTVWLVGPSKGVVDLVQMAGCAGRDRRVAHIRVWFIESLMRSASSPHIGFPELITLMKKPESHCW